MRRSRSRGERSEKLDINGNVSHNLEDSPVLNIETNTNLNFENDFVSQLFFIID